MKETEGAALMIECSVFEESVFVCVFFCFEKQRKTEHTLFLKRECFCVRFFVTFECGEKAVSFCFHRLKSSNPNKER